MDHVPVPFDLYPVHHTRPDLAHLLTPFERRLILSAFPDGSQIGRARYVRDRLPAPIRVPVLILDSTETHVILRTDPHIRGIEREGVLLPVLAERGLPVPRVLAGPAYDPDTPYLSAAIVLGELPGTDLLRMSWHAPPHEQARFIEIVLDGIARIHALSDAIHTHAVARHLARRTLASEVRDVEARGGPWLSVPIFNEAMGRVRPIVDAITTPLVFSSGDYNPGNFLVTEGRLTGFIDFAGACFTDPHLGVATYWTYDWYPLNKAGLVERYLAVQGLSRREFAPRLAVRCLWTLQRELAIDDPRAAYRERLLSLLQQALVWMGT